VFPSLPTLCWLATQRRRRLGGAAETIINTRWNGQDRPTEPLCGRAGGAPPAARAAPTTPCPTSRVRARCCGSQQRVLVDRTR
jgi:hypothetical protein